MKDETLETIIAVTIVLAIIGAILALSLGVFSGSEEDEELYEVPSSGSPAKGVEDAPVEIITFSDFSCAHCAQFHEETSAVLDEYIENGTVRYVYRNYPLSSIHPNALSAARSAWCAYEQDKFWEYHDLLYENLEEQEAQDQAAYAQTIELNMSSYEQCITSENTRNQVEQDIRIGKEYGVSGTPTFFINGARRVGALSPQELSQEIAKATGR